MSETKSIHAMRSPVVGITFCHWSRLLVLTMALGCCVDSNLRATDQAADDIVIADFGNGTYGDWTATGTAFIHGPARPELAARLGIDNFRGYHVATSKINGDNPHGVLTSAEFKVERRYISFLISGGRYEHHTCLNLLAGGKIVHSATGWNSDHMTPISWDVSGLAGKLVQLQIVDEASRDWGHIDVAHIIQTNSPERLPQVTTPLYGESLRPQFHFTARQWTVDRLNPAMRQEGWLNDLNGLIYYDNEYHLFAQRWNKCWIHAVSRDLIRWTELEPAFWEEKLDTGVQSGTCVIDYENTSGLSPNKATPPMVAFWPRNDNRSQCITYSLDHGRSWKFYDKNPVLDHPDRDPKVFWHAPTKRWVMFLYGDKQYHVLTSANLLEWKDEHNAIPDSFECPDFFELPLDGDAKTKKWVLIQGNGKYSIGEFDGTKFKEETGRFPCDIGPNFYATQTWANTETGDGRRIQCAWMAGGKYPNMPFNQQVSFPCELTLHATPEGMRLRRAPIKEIATLHQTPDTWADRTLRAGITLPMEHTGDLFHILADVSIPDEAKLTFDLCGATVILTSKTIESGARAAVAGQIKTVEILVDRTSIEVFINHGEVSSSRCFLPEHSGLSVKADGSQVAIHSLVVYPLKAAVEAPPRLQGND